MWRDGIDLRGCKVDLAHACSFYADVSLKVKGFLERVKFSFHFNQPTCLQGPASTDYNYDNLMYPISPQYARLTIVRPSRLVDNVYVPWQVA